MLVILAIYTIQHHFNLRGAICKAAHMFARPMAMDSALIVPTVSVKLLVVFLLFVAWRAENV